MRRLSGYTIAGLVAALIAALLAALWVAGQSFATRSGAGPDIAHLLRMSSAQAGLSTILSLLTGFILAWSLDRLRFPGRALVVGMLSSALVLPSLVVVAGLIAVWGRAGWINALLDHLGTSIGSSVFGLEGIVLAHVILNGAFAARIMLDRLEAIPPEKLRLGRALGLGPVRRLAILDLPALASTIPGVGATIFLLCFTSFAIVLVLGGGPGNQTLEVAIYEAVRLDFDLGAAVRLSLVQLVVCALIIVPATTLAPAATLFGRRTLLHWPESRPVARLQLVLLVVLLAGFLAPLLAVLVRGLDNAILDLWDLPGFWRAGATSLWVGIASAALCLALAIGLGMARALVSRTRPAHLALGIPVFTYLAVPAVVLSLGFFLLARQTGLSTGAAAPVVLVIANALLSLPFAFATLAPALEAITSRHGRLIRALGLSGPSQWRMLEWPLLARPMGYAAALAFVFSLGDLGVISLFGTESFSTLPWLMFRALGAYRTNDAEAIAALLLILSVTAFLVIPRLFERLAHVRD
ncbi:thiamine/thiamine pyrophosphate ABC transporter permease ThiP [Pelagibacterium montanilacus]|uniref:thiamine/thiamine pyrophosphate ABC transporter permease ThiP n=1 Tax=Pelagibacterium montanilacus TaxID=2185280 RepID=UPI000F8DF514|nr:thiamine/thiamine pyrophosphate ABC transporter permease ThiP [Pelagibacterium montanilacus]